MGSSANLTSRRALITGPASGIGAAIGRPLASERAAVALVDCNGAGVSRVVKEVAAGGGSAVPFVADLTDDAQMLAAVAEAAAALGGIDILVNCAGIGRQPKPVEQPSPEEFDEIFSVNVRSLFLVTRGALPHLNSSTEAVIVNIASNIAVRPRPGYAAYTASKGAVAALTRSLALELAPRGIRVVALCPAASDTPMLVEFMGGRDTDESRRAIAEAIPMARLVQPEEVALVASSDARMVTGELISIDGGRGL